MFTSRRSRACVLYNCLSNTHFVYNTLVFTSPISPRFYGIFYSSLFFIISRHSSKIFRLFPQLPGFATTLPRSSGLAVAIGSTVAGVICGTAVLAYFVKHYISQKADEIHKADLSDDEEEIFPMPDEIW